METATNPTVNDGNNYHDMELTLNAAIGQMIKDARERNGMTLACLSEVTGMDHKLLSAMESFDGGDVTLDQCQTLFDALAIFPIFTDDDDLVLSPAAIGSLESMEGKVAYRRHEYTLHVALEADDITPMVWRRIGIEGSEDLQTLHYLIQAAFGWAGGGFGLFTINGKSYRWLQGYQEAFECEEFGICYPGEHTRVTDVLSVAVTDVLWPDQGAAIDDDEELPYAWVVGGENAAPPEFIAGPHEYMKLVRALADGPQGDGERSLVAQYGEGFHPPVWSKHQANAAIDMLINNVGIYERE